MSNTSTKGQCSNHSDAPRVSEYVPAQGTGCSPFIPCQHSSAPMTPCQHSSAPMAPCQHSSAPMTPCQHSGAPMTPCQHSSAPMIPCQHGSAPIPPCQDSYLPDWPPAPLQVLSGACVLFVYGAGEVGYMAGPLTSIL